MTSSLTTMVLATIKIINSFHANVVQKIALDILLEKDQDGE